jgi:hypothetical protein
MLFCIQAEADYYREVHLLDLEYQAKYDEINKKRSTVVSGEYEPSGKEVRRYVFKGIVSGTGICWIFYPV